MAQTTVSFRMDENLKRSMEQLCSDLGLTMTAAFTIFAKKMTRESRIPFDVSIEQPNADTLAAIAEVQRMKNLLRASLIPPPPRCWRTFWNDLQHQAVHTIQERPENGQKAGL